MLLNLHCELYEICSFLKNNLIKTKKKLHGSFLPLLLRRCLEKQAILAANPNDLWNPGKRVLKCFEINEVMKFVRNVREKGFFILLLFASL